MRAGHTQRRDQHGNTSQQEDGSAERKESAQQYEPMLVQQKHWGPNEEEQGSGDFAHRKRPWNVRHIVEEDIGQRWISFHVGHTFMHDDHNDGCDPSDHKGVT